MEADKANLDEVFGKFTKGSGEMDGKTFAKFTKDEKLITKKLTTTDVDLIFAKIKAKGSRKINLEEFKEGCNQICAKKGITLDQLKAKIAKSGGGPKFAGTKADAVKFHDDKSLWTGVYG